MDKPEAYVTLSLQEVVTQHIEEVLALHQGNISATARALKMNRRTLQRKLRKLQSQGRANEAHRA